MAKQTIDVKIIEPKDRKKIKRVVVFKKIEKVETKKIQPEKL